MIDAIGEATVQQTARVEHNQTENQKSVAANETQRVSAERPVEKAADGEGAKNKNPEDQSRTRYAIDQNRLILEQYGKNGELIMQLPPVHSENV
ncbi:MAG: hypothetical protein ABIL58_29220 [Pseudomonadota bacterium]